MLTLLSTVKTRLALTITDYDGILTNAIKAISDRFDKETNRTLARTTSATHEFDATDTEVSPTCYPIESVTKFETKSHVAYGWIEQTGLSYLLRRQCVVSLSSRLDTRPSTLARLTCSAGYVLPGTTPGAGQTALPDDLEQAVVEQVAYWFRNRDSTGIIRTWPHDGTYQAFLQSDLLLEVRAILKKYKRFLL